MVSELVDVTIDAADNAAMSRSQTDEQHAIENEERQSGAATQQVEPFEEVPADLPAYAEWALEKAGGHGRFQFGYHLYLGLLPTLLCGLSVLSHVFVTMPPVLVASGKALKARDCARPRKDLVFMASSTSLAAEFDLYCKFKFEVALLATVFFLGFAMGVPVSGMLADRRGRKFASCISLVVLQLGALWALLSPSYLCYALARLVTGMGTGGLSVASYVWYAELIGKQSRSKLTITTCSGFAIGIVLLSPMSYMLPWWRALSLVIFILGMPVLVLTFQLQESPKWLATRERTDEMYKGLCYIASVNGHPAPPPPPPRPAVSLPVAGNQQAAGVDDASKKRSVLRILICDGRVSGRLFTMCIAWVACSLSYYGISMNLGNMGGSIYASNAIAGIMDIPAAILTFWAVDHRSPLTGRRGATAGGLVVGGCCCVLCALALGPDDPSVLVQIFLFTGKCAIALSFNAVYLFGAELFPTTVRTTSLGLQSLASRCGGMIAPLVADLQTVWQGMPLLVFGVVSLCAGILATTLPETLGQSMPDTVEEMRVDSQFNCLPRYRRLREDRPVAIPAASVLGAVTAG